MKRFEDIPESPAPKTGWADGETTPPTPPSGMAIAKSKIVAKSTVLGILDSGERVDERLRFVEHPTRPFLFWMVVLKKG